MVLVKVFEGMLSGEEKTSEFGRNFFSFKGIPFAEPPLGCLRFKAPQPKKPWKGVREAKEFGPKCYQIDTFSKSPIKGSEDCLYLNVYTPELKPNKLLPVMVWIHGGGFCCGSGEDDFYGPEFLMRHHVVFVTFNYRLEVLGFLSLDTEDIPGNAGMKDQVAALRWVKRNISNFGGNPENVTIFGQSAGAISVSFHLLSPMSKGLFKRAIMQSGCCTCWFAMCYHARERALILARKMGCQSKNDKDIYNFLKSQPVDKLIGKRVSITFSEEIKKFINIHFGVVSEKKFGDNETFFEGDVYEALRAGIHEDVEVINGYNEHDGILQLICHPNLNDTFAQANEFLEFFVPKPIATYFTEGDQLKVGKMLKNFYFKDKEIGKETLNELLKYLSMDNFIYSAILWMKICANNNRNKIYLYRFSCKSEINIHMLKFIYQQSNIFDRPMVAHSNDLAYIFPMKIINHKVDVHSKSFENIDQVCRLWTNFAKFGDPTPDDTLGERWVPYSTECQHYLDIGQTLISGTFAEKEEIEFWESLFTIYCPRLIACS